jgi:DNA-binding PadR family transcriptional regulator
MAFQDVSPHPGHADTRDGCARGASGRGHGFHRHRNHGQRQGCGAQGRGASAILDEADLRLIMMALLAEQPRTGFETMRALGERLGDGYASSPASVYPNLTLLEEMGLIASSNDPAGRKVYTLVSEGLAALAKNGRLLDAILADTAGAGINPGCQPAGKLRGAPLEGRRHRCCHSGTATGGTV